MKPLPDPYPIKPLVKPPNCTITVPGSKSITNRALILAALADGKCTLRGALWADDTQVMVDSLQKLGFEVTVAPEPAEECNRTITVVGRRGEIPAKKAELYVGNAGTAARFLTALVCLGHGEYTIRGDARMNERPMKELFGALRKLGATIETSQDRLPATVRVDKLQGKRISLNPSQSTQFASALYMIQKHVPGLSLYQPKPFQDDPHGYFAMTRRLCTDFGFLPLDAIYSVEPDLSSASYFVAAEFVYDGKLQGRVKVSGSPEYTVRRVGLQIDGQLPNHLPPPSKVSRVQDLGDSVMTLAVCALFGKQPMKLVDAARMRLQETDRIKAMVTELRRVGAKAEEHEDGFTVWPAEPGQLHGADIETYNDHRMAMCFALLGLKVPGIRIKNPGCVSKTFPNFFEKLEQLRQ